MEEIKQLNAMFHFLESFGYDLRGLSLEELEAVLAGFKSVVITSKVLKHKSQRNG